MPNLRSHYLNQRSVSSLFLCNLSARRSLAFTKYLSCFLDCYSFCLSNLCFSFSIRVLKWLLIAENHELMQVKPFTSQTCSTQKATSQQGHGLINTPNASRIGNQKRTKGSFRQKEENCPQLITVAFLTSHYRLYLNRSAV